MDRYAVPAGLQERLGVEGTDGLVQVLEAARGEWATEVVALSLERFERRLVQELSALRVDIAHGQAALRGDLAQGQAAAREELARTELTLRDRITHSEATLRDRIAHSEVTLRDRIAHSEVTLKGQLATEGAALRVEIAGVRQEIRQEIMDNRFELLKWSFLFWVGQVIAIVGLVGAMLRALGPR